jgi:hypothetical protein
MLWNPISNPNIDNIESHYSLHLLAIVQVATKTWRRSSAVAMRETAKAVWRRTFGDKRIEMIMTTPRLPALK